MRSGDYVGCFQSSSITNKKQYGLRCAFAHSRTATYTVTTLETYSLRRGGGFCTDNALYSTIVCGMSSPVFVALRSSKAKQTYEALSGYSSC